MTMHAGQLHVDARTVRRLLEVQFHEWRGLPVTELRTSGTVNAIFRIGDDLVVSTLDSFGLQDLDDGHTEDAPLSTRPVYHQLGKPRTPSALPGAGPRKPWTPLHTTIEQNQLEPVIGDRPWCRER